MTERLKGISSTVNVSGLDRSLLPIIADDERFSLDLREHASMLDWMLTEGWVEDGTPREVADAWTIAITLEDRIRLDAMAFESRQQ